MSDESPRLAAALDQLQLAVAQARDLVERAQRPPVRMADYLDAFVTWSATECANSEPHVREQRRYLTWWGQRVATLDLRDLDVATHVVPALKGQRALQQRIAALKRFVSYLRNVRRVLDSDVCATLHVPQSTPAQWRTPRAQERACVLRTLHELPAHHRDRLAVLCGTGWHLTELRRFARAGQLLRRGRGRRHLYVLETLHKRGEPHRVPVSRNVWRAAERVRLRGDFRINTLRRAVRAAALRAGLRAWTPGCMRHTVATFAVDHGADLRSVGDFLNHADKRTTRRFYATHAVPRRIPTLL